MNFLLGKMSFGLLLSYPTGGVMPCPFPTLYKVELRISKQKYRLASSKAVRYQKKFAVSADKHIVNMIFV